MSRFIGIKYLLVAILLDLAVKGLVEGRSLRRRHGHHLHSGRYNVEESPIPRELSLERLQGKSFDSRGRELALERNNEMQGWRLDNPRGSLRSEVRRKRHGVVTYKKLSEDRKRAFFRRNNKFDDYYELEVKEAQNISICNYTVSAIPDPTGSRVPSKLEHVKCNHAGTGCYNGTHCCIQTFRMVEIKLANDVSDTIKVYAGCICARQGNTELRKLLPIND